MDETNIFSIILNTANAQGSWMVVFGVVIVVVFSIIMVSKIGEWVLPRPRETRVSDFLPFSRLDEDKATIHCNDGSLVRVFEIKGIDTTMIMPDERQSYMEMRKQWIDSLCDKGITARIITIRERIRLDEEDTHKNQLLKDISAKWIQNLNRIYRNKHYIILSVPERRNAENDLNLASQSLYAILEKYKPVLISEATPEKHADKSPFWLFAQLASPLTRPKPIIGSQQGDDLNSLLTADYVHFTRDEGIVRFFAGDREKLGIVIGIRKPGDFMDEQMIADLLSIDVEVNLLHNIKGIDSRKAFLMLKHQQTQKKYTSPSSNVQMQYEAAKEFLDSTDINAQTLNEYAMSIFILGDSKDELDFGQEEVQRICEHYNVTPVREGWAAQATFFSQFPTYDIYPKTFLYLSRVIACAINLDHAPEGLPKSDWGNGPISYFKTIFGTAYSFQFHVSTDDYAVAHTALIGPTGQGKTTLFSFLAGQAMRHPDLNVYFFDRGNGAKIFALAQDAPYIRFEGGEGATTLNPFATPDSDENRAFLRTWLRAITGCDDALSEQEIARSVTTAYEYLRPEERSLKNLYSACFSKGGQMHRELFRWIGDDLYGRIFNAEQDNLDMTQNQYMAFDFTRIFDDPILAPAVISYIMHRIHRVASSQGTPAMIMIDETAPMLEHPMFCENFITGLREGRKKRQAFLCAFQQPNFLEKKGLGDTIRGQCQTVIFFRNPQASAQDYASWNLSPRELNFVLGREFMDRRYAILVSRPVVNESVILDVDLSGLGPHLKIYSSGAKHVLLAERLKEQIKDTPAFIDAYLKEA